MELGFDPVTALGHIQCRRHIGLKMGQQVDLFIKSVFFYVVMKQQNRYTIFLLNGRKQIKTNIHFL
jgi:hypothetical protein